ncbi:hypothetical protein [Streptomyces violascens]|uniref:hypothetical protein n=1 Tax=Streptomyces violascens TaxID=67381 RepID=UPI00368C768D
MSSPTAWPPVGGTDPDTGTDPDIGVITPAAGAHAYNPGSAGRYETVRVANPRVGCPQLHLPLAAAAGFLAAEPFALLFS